MTGLKAMCIAFSIYSKIPVPIFKWEEKEMKYQLIFFPWIGAIIGALLVGWNYLAGKVNLGNMAYVLIATAIPLIITGGFHVDGYMDTMDAFHSYKSREEKLEILKDPHIGAFAVIMLSLLGMFYIGAISEISSDCVKAYAGAFFVSRCLSGIAVVLFPSAKKDGMLHTFSSSVEGKSNGIVLFSLLIQLLLGAGYMVFMKPYAGLAMILAIAVFFIYYWYKTKKEFGGITGDTAGWFVTVGETVMAVAAAICCVIL